MIKIASRREIREMLNRARREGLDPDKWIEPTVVIDGVRLDKAQCRLVREAIEGFYARDPIATPLGDLPVRDLVRGVNAGNRFERAPARARQRHLVSVRNSSPLTRRSSSASRLPVSRRGGWPAAIAT